MKWDRRKDTKRLLTTILASVLMAVAIRGFVDAGNLVPGGITGLTILIQRIFLKYAGVRMPFSVLNIALNIFPVYIGFRYIGKKFTGFSLLTIVLTSIFTDMIPEMPITYDTLLIALFGGLIGGLSIAMCLRADTTSGGTDFFGIYLSQKKGVDSFDYILAYNVVLLVIAGFLFGWDSALYSIVYQFCSTQVIHILYRDYQQQTLFIVTTQADRVCEEIYSLTDHGATIFHGEGSYEHAPKDLVYSVVSGQQAGQVIRKVRETDPAAFINSIRTTEVKGKFFQKPKD